jgi:lysophospholipid acyltransferase (LPLAT)-like uncharacterized protein
MKEFLAMQVAPWLGYWFIRLLHTCMRIEYRGQERLQAARRESGNYILAFWHSRFLMMPYVYPDSRIVVLASSHRDSRMLGNVLTRFGLVRVEGSSTRGGTAGLRKLLRKVREGYDVGITPDGPKGPRRVVKEGVVATARFTGLPIIPVTFSAHPGRRLKSWDRTLIPRLFTRGLFVIGEPLRIPRDADDEAMEVYRLDLESALNRLTDQADRETGIGPEEEIVHDRD